MNVKAYVNLIANRKFEEAIEEIRKTNPFPAVCGRVCTRPCEDTCELSAHGDAISIRALKRYASDYELARRPIIREPCAIKYSEKIAIIGAGPAGLTAAVDLIKIGYSVSVFEASKEAGGMLRYGIPPYRLPERVLKREIDWIKSLGIEIKNGVKIKDPSSLFKKGYSAILIAGGAPKSFFPGIEGEKSDGVIDSLIFLRQINEGKPRKIRGDVVVVGGGSTAFDAARSALRLGAKKVILAYRRSIDEIPANLEEIEAAEEEGVDIVTLAIPKRIIEKNGKTIGIEFFKAKLGKPDKSGRRTPIPIENSSFTINAKTIIFAIGAMPDVGPINGVKVTTSKGIIDVSEYGKTTFKGIFAAGDIEMGPSSVVDAIGRGHEAARGIDSFLRKIPPSKPEELIKTLQIYLGSPIRSKSIHFPSKKVKDKVSTFEEVEGTYSDFQAVEEASRCFTCGPCYACPTCLPNCRNKQLVAKIEDKTVLVKSPLELSQEIYDNGPASFKLSSGKIKKTVHLYSLTSKVDSNLCIGCGRCEEVCAYRAIKNIITKDKRPVSQVSHFSCASCAACVSECPSGAISQGFMSDDEILKRLNEKETPYDGVKALMSYWSTPSPLFDSYDGVIELMSARKPSPMFLIRALAQTKRGLLVIKPDRATGSHYLPWEESPELVVKNTWKLLNSLGISPDRIRYVDLPKGQNPLNLLKDFSEDLDKKNLKKMNVPIPNSIISPFGESMILLRLMNANRDIVPKDEFLDNPYVKQNEIAYFEGCMPLLELMGDAHNLFDLKHTRRAIYELLKIFQIDVGTIGGFSCPPEGLLNLDKEKYKEIVSKISERNISIYQKIRPKSIIIGTPEAYTSFSNDNNYHNILSIVDELLKGIKDIKKLFPLKKTVAIHKACEMKRDPFYNATKHILSLIPGLNIVELNGKCKHSKFEKIDGNSKQSAINLMKEAFDKGAEQIICTSPYCQSHLLMSSREGSWRIIDVEITDVFRILLSSIEGDF